MNGWMSVSLIFSKIMQKFKVDFNLLKREKKYGNKSKYFGYFFMNLFSTLKDFKFVLSNLVQLLVWYF